MEDDESIEISHETLKIFWLEVVLPNQGNSRNPSYDSYPERSADFSRWLRHKYKRVMAINDYLEFEARMRNRSFKPVRGVSMYADRMTSTNKQKVNCNIFGSYHHNCHLDQATVFRFSDSTP